MARKPAKTTTKKKTVTKKTTRTQTKKKSIKGAVTGGMIGTMVGMTIGGIGIAAMGSAVGIPAIAVAAVLGAGGAVAGKRYIS